jgi:hypothetical protein
LPKSTGYEASHCLIFLSFLSIPLQSKYLPQHTDPKSGLEIQEYGRRDPSHWPCGTLYPQNLAITSPTSGRSVGIVRSRT